MSDRDAQPTGSQTDQEWQLLEAYRDLAEADRVLVWSTILTELGWRPSPVEDDE